MVKESERTMEKSRKDKLLKATTWYLRLAVVLLITLLAKLMLDLEITVISTGLLILAIVSLVLGISFGIGYLCVHDATHEMDGALNG